MISHTDKRSRENVQVTGKLRFAGPFAVSPGGDSRRPVIVGPGAFWTLCAAFLGRSGRFFWPTFRGTR